MAYAVLVLIIEKSRTGKNSGQREAGGIKSVNEKSSGRKEAAIQGRVEPSVKRRRRDNGRRKRNVEQGSIFGSAGDDAGDDAFGRTVLQTFQGRSISDYRKGVRCCRRQGNGHLSGLVRGLPLVCRGGGGIYESCGR